MDKVKAKKIILRTLIGVVTLLVVVSAIQFYLSYRSNTNFEAVEEAFDKKFPRTIDSYPDLKVEAESYTTPYDLMIANDWRVESVYGPFRMKEEASIGVLDCQIRVGDIKNFKKDGFSLLEQEIGDDQYFRIKDLSHVFKGIPSINKQFSNFYKDNKLSYAEYCSLNMMLMVFFDHRSTAQHQQNIQVLKDNLKAN
ncbi:hypothetical protein [Acinetobacter seifertii]|uniref:hypothetical protein n=1 Tax=Acinetobacter seifertii TaxID=1530123 RepID=UPI0032B3FB16